MRGDAANLGVYADPASFTASTADGCWVAIEFSETQIRVGTPWADCGDGAADDKTSIGAVVPLFYGHPNLNRHKYNAFIDKLAADGGVQPTQLQLQAAENRPGASR